jgi:hypothetical protein
MKIVNRGYLLIRPKQKFIDWADQWVEEEFKVGDAEGSEANVYLIEEDFFEIEPLIERNFKKIFTTELLMITDDEDQWPEITIENFLECFDLEIGNTVLDTLSTTIHTEEI